MRQIPWWWPAALFAGVVLSTFVVPYHYSFTNVGQGAYWGVDLPHEEFQAPNGWLSFSVVQMAVLPALAGILAAVGLRIASTPRTRTLLAACIALCAVSIFTVGLLWASQIAWMQLSDPTTRAEPFGLPIGSLVHVVLATLVLWPALERANASEPDGRAGLGMLAATIVVPWAFTNPPGAVYTWETTYQVLTYNDGTTALAGAIQVLLALGWAATLWLPVRRLGGTTALGASVVVALMAAASLGLFIMALTSWYEFGAADLQSPAFFPIAILAPAALWGASAIQALRVDWGIGNPVTPASPPGITVVGPPRRP